MIQCPSTIIVSSQLWLLHFQLPIRKNPFPFNKRVCSQADFLSIFFMAKCLTTNWIFNKQSWSTYFRKHHTPTAVWMYSYYRNYEMSYVWLLAEIGNRYLPALYYLIWSIILMFIMDVIHCNPKELSQKQIDIYWR